MRIGSSLKRVLEVSKAHEAGTVMVADSIEPAETTYFEGCQAACQVWDPISAGISR